MRSALELLHAREGTIAARIVIGAEEREIRYATDPAGALARGADPFVAPALLPAMKLGEPMEVAGRRWTWTSSGGPGPGTPTWSCSPGRTSEPPKSVAPTPGSSVRSVARLPSGTIGAGAAR